MINTFHGLELTLNLLFVSISITSGKKIVKEDCDCMMPAQLSQFFARGCISVSSVLEMTACRKNN